MHAPNPHTQVEMDGRFFEESPFKTTVNRITDGKACRPYPEAVDEPGDVFFNDGTENNPDWIAVIGILLAALSRI
jgi:hypothetical protein